jgi:hypothetical protein
MPRRRTAQESRWFVRMGDHVDGPHPRSRILQWHAEGRLPDDVLLSRDGRRWQAVRWPPAPGGRPGPSPRSGC